MRQNTVSVCYVVGDYFAIVIIQYLHNYDAKINLKLLRNGIFALLNHILTVSAASATCSE